MLDLLALEHFERHVGERFRALNAPGRMVELELIQATSLRAHPDRPGTSFSLIFRGPMASVLPQQIHELEHETLGALAVFLVPLGPEGDPDGMHYQAVFN